MGFASFLVSVDMASLRVAPVYARVVFLGHICIVVCVTVFLLIAELNSIV